MKLSEAERLLLFNQYAILKRLVPEQADYYDQYQDIVQSGYEALYEQLPPHLDEPASFEECREVMSILDMFRAIHFSAKRHGYTPKSRHAQFDGFDGNHEHPHFGLAQFLRRKQGKWAELNDRPDNSHSSTTLPIYRKMLDRWERIGSHELTPEQIEEIAG